MPFIIGETKPINRRTLIRDLSDRFAYVQHVTEDGRKKYVTNIEYVDENIKEGDHIYIAEGRYGHMFVYKPDAPGKRKKKRTKILSAHLNN